MDRTVHEAMRVPILPIALVNAALVLALSAVIPTPVRGQSNCTCRYAAQSFVVSTCACIVTPSGVQRACCGMVLNNPSWNFSWRLIGHSLGHFQWSENLRIHIAKKFLFGGCLNDGAHEVPAIAGV